MDGIDCFRMISVEGLIKSVDKSIDALRSLVDPKTTELAVKTEDEAEIGPSNDQVLYSKGHSTNKLPNVPSVSKDSIEKFLVNSLPKKQLPAPVTANPPVNTQEVNTWIKSDIHPDQDIFVPQTLLCSFCKQYIKKVKCHNLRHLSGCDMKGKPGRDRQEYSKNKKRVHFADSNGRGGGEIPFKYGPASGPGLVGVRSHRANYNKMSGGVIKRYSVATMMDRPKPVRNSSLNTISTMTPLKCPW